MNRNSGGLVWLRRLLDRLGRGNSGYTFTGSAPARRIGRPPEDDDDDGPGVLVPVGPRPRRGGAQAHPPPPEEEPEVRR